MAWYWIAVLLGFAFPWIADGRAIRMAFSERGALVGFGTWLGMAIVPIALLLLVLWAGQMFF
jgi:hypothetical protein